MCILIFPSKIGKKMHIIHGKIQYLAKNGNWVDELQNP